MLWKVTFLHCPLVLSVNIHYITVIYILYITPVVLYLIAKSKPPSLFLYLQLHCQYPVHLLSGSYINSLWKLVLPKWSASFLLYWIIQMSMAQQLALCDICSCQPKSESHVYWYCDLFSLFAFDGESNLPVHNVWMMTPDEYSAIVGCNCSKAFVLPVSLSHELVLIMNTASLCNQLCFATLSGSIW